MKDKVYFDQSLTEESMQLSSICDFLRFSIFLSKFVKIL